MPSGVWKPFGADLLSGILHNTIGGAQIIIRRTVFEQLGGYTEQPHIAWEDMDLLIRLLFADYKCDIIPENIYYYRILETSMSRTYNQYQAQMRVLTVYEEALSEIGLQGLAQASRALFAQYQDKICDPLYNKITLLYNGSHILS